MNARHSNPRPALLSSALAVIVAAAVLLALAGPVPGVGQWLALELVGLAVLAAGTVAYRAGHPVVGVAVATAGGALALLAVAAFGAGSGAVSDRLRLLPGFLGVAVLAGTLAPVAGGGSRALVKAGTGGVFACVVLAGLFETAPASLLLAGGLGSIVAWDAGDYAVGVGDHLGRWARTWRLELTHVGLTVLVGLLGLLAVRLARSVATDGLSLPAFGMVFLAVLLLTVALRW